MRHFRELLQEPVHTARGTFVKIAHSDVVELLALAGFDFVIIDMEHAPLGLAEVHQLIGAARGAGIPPLVRVPELDDVVIARVLDSGAHGVLVPHIQTREDAERLVRAARLPPDGNRGYGPTVRAGGWGSDVPRYRRLDRQAALIPQIECSLGVQNAAQIAAVPGIDHLFLGMADLAASTGLDPSDPAFAQLLATVADAAASGNMPLGTAIGAVPETTLPEALTACRFWAISNDAGLLLHGSRSALAEEEFVQHEDGHPVPPTHP
ncbi:aldolase/citrate lyase family protein [Pseudarthrobacter sp. HLT3-5]|uniref:HpcH/HpaI aldolase family protein n=1 Tax=Pseudarthrobacter cellobiosi TaxID=2953654 RepID=UPI00208EF803|nr:aldolase/citrate lyase family protein [Pseudarthrobacter sp. HLT3-5]MCO4273809.1 aldolase/citrate lyase family protein [Pseudarthrobacter sp. HLT3-5]